MPVAVKRHVQNCDDMDGRSYALPVYYVFVFRKEIPIILFYMAHGLGFTLDYLNVSNIVEFSEYMPNFPDLSRIYFQLSTKCYMSVDRAMFNQYPFVQSIVGAFFTITSSRVTMEALHDPKVWIKKIANPANYDKGLSILKYFGRLMDESTKKMLRLPEYYKSDIYAVLKWMMQHFNELRLKDNCDLDESYCPSKIYLIA
jgi:hypothetical protein